MMLGFYTAPPSSGGQLLLDASPFAEGVTFSTNDHGFEALPASIRRWLFDAFRFYDQAGIIYVALSENGLIVWEGRLEDPAVFAGARGSGLNIQALGAWRALTDDRYTMLWSHTKTADYRYGIAELATTYNESGRWQGDTNNRLYITLVKGNTYTLNKAAGWFMFIPDDSSGLISGYQLEIESTLPTQMTLRIVGFDISASGTLINGVVHASLVGTGATQRRAYHASGFNRQVVGIDVLCNTGFTYAAETDAAYAKITKVRATKASTNRVNTTLTANRNAGTSVTATVGSTARMYVGMQLVMNAAANPSEIVTVESITSSTQFVATFVNNYVIGNAVQGHIIYADEIAKDIVAQVSALNAGQLSSSTALIQSPSVDLTDELYEDAVPADILTYLAALGDNQTLPQQWEVGVWEGRVLHFRPHGDAARAWYVDVTDLGVARTLEDLANSVYATYQDANGRTLRTNVNTDSAGVSRYGLTRRASISADTTSNTQAGIQRDAQLADHKDPLPRASVSFGAVYDATGARWPLWMVRSGDTVTIRNLPPTTSTAIDRIRTFRISHTQYTLATRTLDIELEVPPPRLETMLTRQAAGIR